MSKLEGSSIQYEPGKRLFFIVVGGFTGAILIILTVMSFTAGLQVALLGYVGSSEVGYITFDGIWRWGITSVSLLFSWLLYKLS